MSCQTFSRRLTIADAKPTLHPITMLHVALLDNIPITYENHRLAYEVMFLKAT